MARGPISVTSRHKAEGVQATLGSTIRKSHGTAIADASRDKAAWGDWL